MPTLRHFRFWCQSVLPLVYDDSLSYYEVLCKVVNYINNLIDSDKEIIKDIDGLKADIAVIQEWIDKFDEEKIVNFLDRYIKFIFFGLTDDGYFVAYIPDTWNEITFSTSQYDDFTTLEPEFGHLILSY